MVAEPVVATETAPASEPVTPVSTETPVPASIEEQVPSPSGEETHEEPGQEPAPEPTLQELDTLYREGKLSDPALVEKRENLRKAADDRQREWQRWTATQQAEENARVQALQKMEQDTFTAILEDHQRIDGRPLDDLTASELKADATRAHLAKLMAQSREIHLAPHEAKLRAALLFVHGDSPRNRQTVNSKDLPDLINDLYAAAFQQGQDAGPGIDMKVSPVKEWHKDGYHTSSYTKGQDDLKAAHPDFFGKVPPPLGGVSPPAGGYSLAQIDAMSTSTWMGLGDRETRQRILDNAHERANREGAKE